MLLLKTSCYRLKLFSSNLTRCLLHPLMNSFLLFNNRLPLKCSRTCNFSAKHSGQKLIFVLPYTFSTIDHLILDAIRSCTFFVFSMVKIFVVIWKLGFERCFCKTKVYFGTFICVIFNHSSVY